MPTEGLEPAPSALDESLLAAGISAIDAVNATDPVPVTHAGASRPKELVHAERMTYWVRALDPEPTASQLLAARAHHLRRWAVPRSDYPEGRAGYLRWRTDQAARQAAEAAELLAGVGIDDVTIERVRAIVTKRRRTTDPEVQTHEDALCLVFLELQLDDVAGQLGEERAVEVLRRTARKMSDRGLAAAAELPLSPEGARLLGGALAAP